MTITFVGHGYVGLVTACVFADFGNDVWVVGRTPEKIKKLTNGDPLIYEPGLEEMLQRNLQANRLHFTLEYDKAIPASEIVFIAVGTPPSATGEADLSSVLDVGENIGKHLSADHFTVVSCKSTVPVGTNLKVKEIIEQVKPPSAEFAMASCPEFLREGTGIYDTLNPDRVVVGSYSQKAIDLVLQVHKPLPGERVVTDLASAEIIKYASNAMLATKISFANLISLYAEKTGGNIETIMDAVGADKRIGRRFLFPGIGYGGSCFPKDVMALTETGKQIGLDTKLLDAVEEVNIAVRTNFIEKVKKYTKGKKVGIWGLSFKPNTDDIRFAPSLHIIEALLKEGFKISAFDPAATENVKNVLGDNIAYTKSMYDATKEVDALLIFTEWNEFRQANLKTLKKLMKTPLIIDGRNIYDPEKMREIGFTYVSTGRLSIE